MAVPRVVRDDYPDAYERIKCALSTDPTALVNELTEVEEALAEDRGWESAEVHVIRKAIDLLIDQFDLYRSSY